VDPCLLDDMNTDGSSPSHNHHGDFRQRLEMLLMSEECAKAVARKLYPRFQGDTRQLPEMLHLLEDKWNFPDRIFPLLWGHLRRSAGEVDLPPHVETEQWAEAFYRWLQAIHARCSRAKVSRQCLVQERLSEEMDKVYFRGAKLGEGRFGEVSMALQKQLGVTRVVKTVPKAQLGVAEERVESEVDLLKSLDHPHIIRIFETFESDTALHIVMDYAEGGDLAAVIADTKSQGVMLSESWVCTAAVQVGSALEFMHARGVIHCDLKPANTMLLKPFETQKLESPHILLADFGLSEIFEEQQVGRPVEVKGTPMYLAPEAFDGHLTQKSDMWAFGVMLYEIMVGTHPFQADGNIFVLWTRIVRNQPCFERIPLQARSAIESLLEKDPAARPTARTFLNQEWVGSHGSNENVAKIDWDSLGHISYLDRATFFCIASGLSMKDMHTLYEAFAAIDTDNSGFLTRQEISEGLLKQGLQQDPQRIVDLLDLDQNGHISYTEFLAGAMHATEELTEQHLRYAFDIFDCNGDGFISLHELYQVLSGNGSIIDVLPDGSTVEQVMAELARGGTNISYADFQAHYRRTRRSTRLRENNLKLDKTMTDLSQGRMSEVGSLSMMTMILELDVVQEQAPEQLRKRADRFPEFQEWLSGLRQESNQNIAFHHLLPFADKNLEACYVEHYILNTYRQITVMFAIVFVYGLWGLTVHNLAWEPTFDRWDKRVLAAYNVIWLLFATLGLAAMIFCCACPLSRLRQGSFRRILHSPQHALFVERCICLWGCLLPWLLCSVASRCRIAVIFGAASDAFHSVNSDNRPMYSMLGMLMFFFDQGTPAVDMCGAYLCIVHYCTCSFCDFIG